MNSAEPETHRLQREADQYTKDVEHNKKDFQMKEDMRKNQQIAIDQVYKNIDAMIPSEEDVYREKVKRANL